MLNFNKLTIQVFDVSYIEKYLEIDLVFEKNIQLIISFLYLLNFKFFVVNCMHFYHYEVIIISYNTWYCFNTTFVILNNFCFKLIKCNIFVLDYVNYFSLS